MTDRYQDKSELSAGRSSKTTLAAEVFGADLEATRIRNSLEYTWEEESSGARYDITLYEDGYIEVEVEDPLRFFANSPLEEFNYSNKDSHIRELEEGDRITREKEAMAEEDRLELNQDGEYEIKDQDEGIHEDLKELPDANLIDLYKLTNMIQEGATEEEIPQEYLDDLVTKVQRAAVAWESDTGEEVSKYR